MNLVSKTLMLVLILMCSGCSKADTSDARRDHILSGDHGWIDLTINKPSQKGGLKAITPCLVSFSTNGETLINESVDLAKADASKNPIGYRFAVPSGLLQAELVISSCIKNQQLTKLSINLIKDQLATIRFDGQNLTLQDATTYDPTTLEKVREEVKSIQVNGESYADNIATLKKLVIVSLLFNFIIMLGFVLRRRRIS